MNGSGHDSELRRLARLVADGDETAKRPLFRALIRDGVRDEGNGFDLEDPHFVRKAVMEHASLCWPTPDGLSSRKAHLIEKGKDWIYAGTQRTRTACGRSAPHSEVVLLKAETPLTDLCGNCRKAAIRSYVKNRMRRL